MGYYISHITCGAPQGLILGPILFYISPFHPVQIFQVLNVSVHC